MKRLLIAASKRYPVVRVLHHHYILVRSHIGWLRHGRHAITANTIIFQAYNGRYACSPKALYESMVHDPQFAQYSFIWVVSDCKKYQWLAKQPRTTLVRNKSQDYYRAFAQAETWVVNIMLPLRIVKRKGQVMVQCWHGTPLKRLRADIIENTKNAMNTRQDFIRKNMIDIRRYDYFLSPSRFATEKFISAFGIQKMHDQGRILEIGYPRNDALFDPRPEIIESIKRRMHIPLKKKVILYTPTWRDDQHDAAVGYTHQNMLDFTALQKAVGDEYIVLFRAHYLVANTFDFAAYKHFAYDVSDLDDINELYLIADVMVTDYSSTVFDFANTGKPMFFFTYDKIHYEQHLRGFYFDINDLPGEISDSQVRLTNCLQNLETYQQKHKAKYTAFARRFTYLDDGQAAKRLQKALFAPPPDTVPIPAHTTTTMPLTTREQL